MDPDPVVRTDCAELWAELEQARAERERMRHRTDVMCRRRPRSAPVRASMFDTPPSTPTSRVITGFAHCHERGACPASPTPRTNAATPPSTPTNCHERGACPASSTPRTNTAHWSPHAHSPTTPENWPCGHYSHSPPLPWPSVPAWPHAAETIQPTVGSLPSVVTTPCHPTPPGHSQYLLGRWQFLPHRHHLTGTTRSHPKPGRRCRRAPHKCGKRRQLMHMAATNGTRTDDTPSRRLGRRFRNRSDDKRSD